jgi:hypothetical protein
MINVYLDDLRPCPMGPRWVLARDAETCLLILERFKGEVSILSLDHDLQDTSVPEKHGKWLVNQMVERGLYADRIYLHTANGVGRENMLSYLLQAHEMNAIPDHVQILSGPWPHYNMETGALIYD